MAWLSDSDRDWLDFQNKENKKRLSGKMKAVEVRSNGENTWLNLPYPMYTSDINEWVKKQGHNRITGYLDVDGSYTSP